MTKVVSMLDKPKSSVEQLFDELKNKKSANLTLSDAPLPPATCSNITNIWASNLFGSTSSNSHNLDASLDEDEGEMPPLSPIKRKADYPVDNIFEGYCEVASQKENLDTENDTNEVKLKACCSHKDVSVFDDIPGKPCKNPGCQYYAEKSFIRRRKHPNISKDAQFEGNNERRRCYMPLNLREEKRKPVLGTGRRLTLAPSPKSIISTSFSTKSFYGRKLHEDGENLPPLIEYDDSEKRRARALKKVASPPPAIDIVLEPHEIGLKNFGNTCYVNATLQALLALPQFTDDLEMACEGKKNLPESLVLLNDIAAARKLLNQAEVNFLTDDYIRTLWKLHPSYDSCAQQDANEFLIRMIDCIKSALPAGNPVDSHFEYELVDVYECKKCGESVGRAEKHTSICLPVLESSHNLEQCLDDFTAEDERPVECPACKAPTMTASVKFRTLPSKLVLSLNRYSKEEKITQSIIPPEVLQLGRFMEDADGEQISEFDLFAQIAHVGDSKNSGHYISHIHCADDVWRCYSDMEVRKISFQEEIQSAGSDPAYVYFYVRKTQVTLKD